MGNNVVVGLDGGGTRTRVAVADLDGHILGVAKRGGASTEFNDSKMARQNLREGVRTALTDAEQSPSDVAALTAGVGSLNISDNYTLTEQALDIDGLACEPHVVTDEEIAHTGAFRNNPGIVAICGTGSLVFGITADGKQISNYDFIQYARAGAHNLGERALHAILGSETPVEWTLGDQLLDHWDCDSVPDLRMAVYDEDRFTNVPSGNPLDSVAPLITAAAGDGDPTAQTMCNDAIAEVVTGVRLVGGFLDNPVTVASAGSVLRSKYMSAEFQRQVADVENYRVVEPAMSPVAGAVFDAIDRVTNTNDAVVEWLTDHAIGQA